LDRLGIEPAALPLEDFCSKDSNPISRGHGRPKELPRRHLLDTIYYCLRSCDEPHKDSLWAVQLVLSSCFDDCVGRDTFQKFFRRYERAAWRRAVAEIAAREAPIPSKALRWASAVARDWNRSDQARPKRTK
jgi:hypothetical protein